MNHVLNFKVEIDKVLHSDSFNTYYWFNVYILLIQCLHMIDWFHWSILSFQNYNKSRIHSYRGAKDVIIQLDSNVIFKGEIARACGGIEGGTEAFGDVSMHVMELIPTILVSENMFVHKMYQCTLKDILKK